MEGKTLDNVIVKLRVATLIALLTFAIVATFHVTRTMGKIEQLEAADITIDNRITKTTGRNSKRLDKIEGQE